MLVGITVVTIEAKPSAVHKALVDLGLKPGAPVMGESKEPPQGPEVLLYLEVTGPDGEPRFLTNHAGGILGGISTGQPIVCRFAVKPTSSILTPRKTIDRDGNESGRSPQVNESLPPKP